MGFGITAAWWTAPVYTVLSDLIPAHRRATAISIFNLGLTMVGAGLGPLLVGMFSDALVPQFGQEALRWALAICVVACYGMGLLAFLATARPYGREYAPTGAPASS
jgi:MFS family permease